MKNLVAIIIIICSATSIQAQNISGNFRLGLSTKTDKNVSSEMVAFDKYTGYSAEYDKINYRLGLDIEYKLKKGFTINSAVNFSNKDFKGTYYCAVCDFSVPPRPEDIDFRFLEIPLSLRYYFLPERFKIFVEAGVNNQLLLNKEVTDRKYGLGMKFGSGVEYDFNKGTALQILLDYNKGVTDLYHDSDFKVDYVGFGVGVLKKL